MILRPGITTLNLDRSAAVCEQALFRSVHTAWSTSRSSSTRRVVLKLFGRVDPGLKPTWPRTSHSAAAGPMNTAALRDRHSSREGMQARVGKAFEVR